MRCRSPFRRRHAAMSLILAAGILFVLVSGCASLANTPEQDLALSRWNACRTQVPSAELRRVQTDGRIFFWYSGPSEAQAIVACLQQAGKGGPALPEPTPEPRSGGGGGM
jgi:hypothetical protein